APAERAPRAGEKADSDVVSPRPAQAGGGAAARTNSQHPRFRQPRQLRRAEVASAVEVGHHAMEELKAGTPCHRRPELLGLGRAWYPRRLAALDARTPPPADVEEP